MRILPNIHSYPTTIGYPAKKERAKLAHMSLNWIPTFVGMSGIGAVILLSACSAEIQHKPEEEVDAPKAIRVVEEDKPTKSIEVTPAAHMATSAKQSEPIILQDGVDAFLGYQRIDVPESLSGSYPELNKGILAFILAFNLRALANEESVSAWAKIRRSKAGEITWQYELTYLPDDAIYAVDYKVYFEQVKAGYKIARIGHRVKCYRGPNPKQWTVELCP